MFDTFTVEISGWANGAAIPAKYAFAKIDAETHVALSENLNPGISWSRAPSGTKSFAIICHDPDVPSSSEAVNQEGKTVSADLSRVDFYHWVLIDIPSKLTSIKAGAASTGITPKGKPIGAKSYGVAGINSYTDWFAGDADMAGDYGDYDGPCPPWNDSILHHYHFILYALDIASLGLSGPFTGTDAIKAMQNHILGQCSYMGTYSLNPRL